MAYTYDPSQKIEQGFGKASADIGNVFTAVIAQQQRDYNLAENTFQNIEALKKNLNIFGQKNITAKSNELLAQTSSAILKDGKLDYTKLGEMRQQISSIGDLKVGYDIGAKEYERMLQLGIANKDNLFSFEKFYKDLSAKMGDENLVRNPQDLQKSLVEAYSNNLDSGAMFGKDYLKRNPLKPASIDVIDPKTGALNRISGELAYGWSYNAQGKMIPPASVTTTDPITGAPVILDYVDQELAKLKAMNPDLLAQLRKQTGSAGVNLSDKEIVKFNLDRTPTGTANITQVRSANQIKGEELTVTKGTFDVEHQKQEFNAKMGQIGASTAASRATTKLTNAKVDALNATNNPTNITGDLSEYGIDFTSAGKSINLGASGGIEISVTNPDKALKGTMAPFKAMGLRTLANGKKEIFGYIGTSSIAGNLGVQMFGKQTAYLPYGDAEKKSLLPTIKNLGKDKQGNMEQALSIYNRMPNSKSAAKAPDAAVSPMPKPITPKPIPDPAKDNSEGYDKETKTLYIKRRFTKDAEKKMIHDLGATDVKYID